MYYLLLYYRDPGVCGLGMRMGCDLQLRGMNAFPVAPMTQKRAHRQDLPNSADLTGQQDLPHSVMLGVLNQTWSNFK